MNTVIDKTNICYLLHYQSMSKKKGDRRERQAREILEYAGYTVESPNSTPYPQGYGVDFFGLFDFMAFKDDEKPLFGQVKSNGFRGIRSFSEECKEHQVPFDFVEVQYWTCYDGEGWRIADVYEDGYDTVYDERDYDMKMLHTRIEDDNVNDNELPVADSEYPRPD